MNNRRGKDMAVSVRDRLLNLARERGEDFQLILTRNSFNDVLQALEEGRSPIVLTERKEHRGYFARQFHNFTTNLIVLQGGKTARKRREELNRLATIPDNEERLVLATGRNIGGLTLRFVY